MKKKNKKKRKKGEELDCMWESKKSSPFFFSKAVLKRHVASVDAKVDDSGSEFGEIGENGLSLNESPGLEIDKKDISPESAVFFK